MWWLWSCELCRTKFWNYPVLFQSRPIKDCIDIIDNKHTQILIERTDFIILKKFCLALLVQLKTYLKWTYDIRKYRIKVREKIKWLYNVKCYTTVLYWFLVLGNCFLNCCLHGVHSVTLSLNSELSFVLLLDWLHHVFLFALIVS